MQENNYARYSFAGVAVIDEDCTGQEICGVPVVATKSSTSMYVCQEWIDEVLMVIPDAPSLSGRSDRTAYGNRCNRSPESFQDHQ